MKFAGIYLFNLFQTVLDWLLVLKLKTELKLFTVPKFVLNVLSEADILYFFHLSKPNHSHRYGLRTFIIRA